MWEEGELSEWRIEEKKDESVYPRPKMNLVLQLTQA